MKKLLFFLLIPFSTLAQHELMMWVGATHINGEINGQTIRFERTTLYHDNRGHSPSYQIFLTLEAYRRETEVAELRSLLIRTNFIDLTVEKQRAIRAILEA